MKQNKLKKMLLIVVLIGTSLFPTIARSNEDDAVGQCISKCDKALADQGKVINFKTRTISSQDETIKAQDVRITELEKGGSIFKSPLLYVVAGMIIGGFLVGRTK